MDKSINIEHSDEEPDFDDFDNILDTNDADLADEDGENKDDVKPEGGEGDEAKEVKPKRRAIVRNPQPKLDVDRLKTERGLVALREAQKNMVFKGKGHEEKDLDHILFTLEHWGNRLFPKLSFDDFLEKTAKLGSKKMVSNFVHKMRMGDTLDLRRENGDIIEDEVIDDKSEDENPMDDQFEDDDHLLFARNDNDGGNEAGNKITDEDYERNRNAMFDSLMNEAGPSTSVERNREPEVMSVDDTNPTDVPFDSVLKQILESSNEDEAVDMEDDEDEELIRKSRNMRKQLLDDSDSDESITEQSAEPTSKNNPSEIPLVSAMDQIADDSDDEVVVKTPSHRRKRLLDDDDDGIPDQLVEDKNEYVRPNSVLSSDDEEEDPILPSRRRKRTRVIEEDDDGDVETPLATSDKASDVLEEPKDVTEMNEEEPKKKAIEDQDENRAPLYDGPNIEWSDFGL